MSDTKMLSEYEKACDAIDALSVSDLYDKMIEFDLSDPFVDRLIEKTKTHILLQMFSEELKSAEVWKESLRETIKSNEWIKFI